MASGTNLVKRILGVKDVVVEDVRIVEEPTVPDGAGFRIDIDVRSRARDCKRCPVCGRKCPGYDHAKARVRWRSPDFNGVKVFLCSRPCRVRRAYPDQLEDRSGVRHENS